MLLASMACRIGAEDGRLCGAFAQKAGAARGVSVAYGARAFRVLDGPRDRREECPRLVVEAPWEGLAGGGRHQTGLAQRGRPTGTIEERGAVAATPSWSSLSCHAPLQERTVHLLSAAVRLSAGYKPPPAAAGRLDTDHRRW